MKASNYNFLTRSDDGFMLMYNTRTGAFIAVPEHAAATPRALLADPDAGTDAAARGTLLDAGFLVEDDFNERQQVEKRFRAFQNSKGMSLTLFPSENCNFRCPYCFIYDRRGMAMEPWVYKAVLELIKRNIVPDFDLNINWFGGEPTLEKENMISFMGEVRQELQKHRVRRFTSAIYTNGYLLTKEAFADYLHAGISTFQVTLDGPEAAHNKTRSLKSGQGTFRKIWGNLESIKSGAAPEWKFKLRIRVNFLTGQDREIETLTEAFRAAFGTDPRFSIVFKPVFSATTSRDDVSVMESEIFSFEDGIAKQLDYQLASAKKTGVIDVRSLITSPVPDPIPGWCQAEQRNSWSVGADGLLFKCDTYSGDTSKASGRLREDGSIELNGRLHEWDTSVHDSAESKCAQCKFLPVCQGGCARKRAKRIAEGNCYFNEERISKAMAATHEYYQHRKRQARTI